MTTAAHPVRPAAAPRSSAGFRVTVRGLRLGTGLVLFSYVLLHLLNHALGNVSLPVMEAGLDWMAWFWGLPGIGLLLYGSVAIHGALALYAVYSRPRLEWRPAEFAQLALGFAIVPLLASHVLGTRLQRELYGTQQGYSQLLYLFWVASPLDGLRQVVALLVTWAHGCLGLYFSLRLKPIYRRLAPALLCLAMLIPVLALLGFVHAGRTVATLAQDEDWRVENLPGAAKVEPGQTPPAERLADLYRRIAFGTAGGLVLALGARFVRRRLVRRGGTVRLTYPGGAVAEVPKGTSVLEASRLAGIAHASVCGGRGRCSTCRVRLSGSGVEHLPPPSAAELAVLLRVGAAEDVRLACQLRPTRDLAIAPLLPSQTGAAQVRRPTSPAAFGEERTVVAMFVDMRGSTRLAERRLPFDTVFIINRFLEAVANGVVEAGGAPNQLLGDGLMALFGIDAPAPVAARQAIEAVQLIGRNVHALNQHMAQSLDEPVRFGIGLHAGVAILGEIGDRERGRAVFTAIGDPVNVASRLQGATKRLGCEALISEAVFEAAELVCTVPAEEVAIDGRNDGIRAHPVVWAREAAPVEGATPEAAAPAIPA